MSERPQRVLSAEDIDKASDHEGIVVEVPEWGGPVALRRLPSEEYVALNDELKDATEKKGVEATYLMVGRHLANADWSRLYENDEKARAALTKRSLAVLVRLQQRISTLYKGDEAEAKKGSGETTLVASPIGSPPNSGA